MNSVPLKSLFLVLSLAVTPLVTEAASVTARKANLNHRRNKGFRTGQLTYGEDVKLQGARDRLAGNIQQLKILKANADADGHRTAPEKAAIHAMRHAIKKQENHISRMTYRLKHNAIVGHPHTMARTQQINAEYKPPTIAPPILPASVSPAFADSGEGAGAAN